jgi:hypothetical protein
MNTRRLWMRSLAAGMLTALAATPLLASKPVMPSTISGTLTSSRAGEIVVDDRTYHIQPGSEAASEVANLQAGQSVQVTLNGPPNSQRSQVVEIHATGNR